jgi:hypothetical protein
MGQRNAAGDLDFDRRWDRDVSREPTWTGPTRPRHPLTGRGTLRTAVQQRAELALRYGGHCSACHVEPCTCADDSPCSVDHERVKQDPFWSALHWVGIQPDTDDEGNQADLELRNCYCGTTLARPAKRAA